MHLMIRDLSFFLLSKSRESECLSYTLKHIDDEYYILSYNVSPLRISFTISLYEFHSKIQVCYLIQ